jgi:hypothetical protein
MSEKKALEKIAEGLHVFGTNPDYDPQTKFKRLIMSERDKVGVASHGKTLIYDEDQTEIEARKNRVRHFINTHNDKELADFIKKYKIAVHHIEFETNHSTDKVFNDFIDWRDVDAAIEAGAVWGTRKWRGQRWVEKSEADQLDALDKIKRDRAVREAKRIEFIADQKEKDVTGQELEALLRSKFADFYFPDGKRKPLSEYLDGDIN